MTLTPLPPDSAPAPAHPPQGGPVRERDLLPDVLRGVALLGILTVNMQDFAGFLEWRQTGLDGVAQVLTDVVANGRFISIFAMLFGWGAAGILARQGPQVFVRRHLILLLVGALHFVLVWHGDIISNYALLAFLLLLTPRLKAPALLLLALLSGGYGLWVWVMDALSAQGGAFRPRFTGLPDLSGHPGYAQLVAERVHDFLPNLIGGNLYNGPWLLALFLLGAAAQRTGLLSRPLAHLPLLRRLAWVGLPLGLLTGVWLAVLNTAPDRVSGLLAIPVRMAGGLLGALGYVGVLGLLAARGRLGWLSHFAASGRVAMSNYLAQSLVMTTLFYPYAGAQFGRWGAAAGLVLALAFGLLQLPVSRWWLSRLGMGPVEKLVRTLVYAGRKD
ncbi:DUF418 domain-containing protein [Deinococcus taklimakanensis]|uniref:DUF418 domain-containing protein n=1 Tax=Deinococcus taklimakanensis TaxID=536443 RepID=A0ABW5NYF2_9DEIO